MKIKISALIFFITQAALGLQPGAIQGEEIYQPETVVNIRAKRNIHSPVVGKLYPGNRVRAGFLKDGWYAVFRLHEPQRDESSAFGYVSASFLKPVDDSSKTIKPSKMDLAETNTVTVSENYCKLEASYNLDALKQLVPKLSKISKPHTGDLKEMIGRRAVRVLTPYSLTHYYVQDGRSFGFEYSLLKEYEKFLNKSIKKNKIKVSVEFIPLPEKHLIQSLRDGLGDIAVTGSPFAAQNHPGIDVTTPYLEGIKHVLVANKNLKIKEIPGDLANKNFYLRPSSGYFETLGSLNESLVEMNLPPATVVISGDFFNAEDILELLDAGIIRLSILESHMASLWYPVFSNIKIYDEITYSKNDSVSFAVRKNNPQLKASLNHFIKSHKIGTLLGNIFFQKYFKDSSRLKNPFSNQDKEKFSKFAPLFKKYGELYGFDWMLLAAVAYQESGMDPAKRSPAGAFGLMQLLPSTAKDHRIQISDIREVEINVRAGVKYLALLRDAYFSDSKLEPAVRTRFALAAYNAGPANIIRSRKTAFEMGYDPDLWFGNTEYAVLRVVGTEPVRYVSNINKYYLAYSLSSALDCLKNQQKQQMLSVP